MTIWLEAITYYVPKYLLVITLLIKLDDDTAIYLLPFYLLLPYFPWYSLFPLSLHES